MLKNISKMLVIYCTIVCSSCANKNISCTNKNIKEEIVHIEEFHTETTTHYYIPTNNKLFMSIYDDNKKGRCTYVFYSPSGKPIVEVVLYDYMNYYCINELDSDWRTSVSMLNNEVEFIRAISKNTDYVQICIGRRNSPSTPEITVSYYTNGIEKIYRNFELRDTVLPPPDFNDIDLVMDTTMRRE